MHDLFISFANPDADYKDKLLKHLSGLLRMGLINAWDQNKVLAGSELKKETLTHLQKAKIIIFLISPDFLASDFIHDYELKLALKKLERGESKIIPIVIRPCMWENSPLIIINESIVLPRGGHPVSLHDNEDAAFKAIVREIMEIIQPPNATFNQAPILSNNLSHFSFLRNYFAGLKNHFEKWSELYTDLRVTSGIRVATYKGGKNSQNKDQFWFDDLFGLSKDKNETFYEKIVIIGDPGGGKTTACERAVWKICENNLELIQERGNKAILNIPVYLPLSIYRLEPDQLPSANSHVRILELIVNEINRRLSFYDPNKFIQINDFLSLMKYHSCVFFFDGLNEVGLKHRYSLVQEIKLFVETFQSNGHQFVITTRKLDYEDIDRPLPFTNLSKHLELEILEFDRASMHEFILRDLGQIGKAIKIAKNIPEVGEAVSMTLEKMTKEREFEEIKLLIGDLKLQLEGQKDIHIFKNIDSAVQLIDILEQGSYEKLLWLAQNPATLKDIIDVYKEDGEIPKSRVILFERAIINRLSSQSIKRQRQFPLELKLELLQILAGKMSQPDEGLSLDGIKVMDAAKDLLGKFDLAPRDSKKLIDELLFEDGLLIKKTEQNVFEFRKQPFQEYFAARNLRDIWTKTKKPFSDSKIQSYIKSRHYFQHISMMVGLLPEQNAQSIINHFWNSRNSLYFKRLAANCIRQSGKISEKASEKFSNWTKKKILRYIYLPDEFIAKLLTVIYLFLLLISFNLQLLGENPLNFFINSIPDWSKTQVYLLLFVVYSILAFVCRYVLVKVAEKGAYHIENTERRILHNWLLILTVLSRLLLLTQILSPLISFLEIISNISLILLMFRTFYFLIQPLVSKVSSALEDQLVKRYVIPYLEIMREIGPNSSAIIAELKEKIGQNQFMSVRIKDAVNRTWAPSPKTALQIIDDVFANERHAEAVSMLSGILAQEKYLNPNIYEKAVEAILYIIESSSSLDSSLNALDIIEKLIHISSFGDKGRYIQELIKIGNKPNVDRFLKKRIRDILQTVDMEQSVQIEFGARSKTSSILVQRAIRIVILLIFVIFLVWLFTS